MTDQTDTTPRVRLLDLFCGAGGCTKGYQRAGFTVTGVDLNPQPNYIGGKFHRADALDFLANIDPDDYDAIHASPPCQAYTRARKLQNNDHPELLDDTRELLVQTGLPYVIENVKGAPLIAPVMLEGQMFGLNTHRPRLFETNWPLTVPTLVPPPPRQAKMGRPPKPGEAIQVVGHFSDIKAAREAMGIWWMTAKELAQAIPPAYTAFIGDQLIRYILDESEWESIPAYAAGE